VRKNGKYVTEKKSQDVRFKSNNINDHIKHKSLSTLKIEIERLNKKIRPNYILSIRNSL
jgi:hypothetical protein